MKGKKRIFLADDHPAVRQGVKYLLLEAGLEVCGEADSAAGLRRQIGPSGADLILVDLSLGEESGLECIEELGRGSIKILAYSMHENAETINRAFAAGADGYVSKRESPEVLLAVITDVLAGNRHVSPRIARSLASSALARVEAGKEGRLAERERQILNRLGRGETNAEIAGALAIGVRTVETYCSRIIAKLKLDGMRALRRYAIERRHRRAGDRAHL